MIKCHHIPILDSDVYFITSRDEVKAFMAEHSSPEPDAAWLDDLVGDSVGFCSIAVDDKGKNHRMLCVFDGMLNTAVHESVHMAWMVAKRCSIKFDRSNQEPMAYLIAYLADEMWKVMQEGK